MIAATPVLLLLFLMLLVSEGYELTLASFAVPIALVISFFVAHLAIRKFAPNADGGILPIVFLLAGIGICFVLRLADETTALKQIGWLFAGIACLVLTIIFVPSIEKLGEYKYTTLLVGVVLLLLPMLPVVGVEYNGSRIWLSIAGFSFQPGELAKIAIILFLASYLADHREMLSTLRSTRIGIKIPDLRTMFPLIAMWAVAMLVIIFEKDLGSALLLFGIFLAMLYICTGRISYVLIGILLLAIGGTALYFVFSHVQTRIAIWLDPFAYATDSGYQLVQSLYSLADGGLFGSGIGRGLPTYIPEVASDFIFSAIGEELGLFGAAGVIIMYILFAVRGFATAARAKSDVAAFTAAGVSFSIALQAFIIIGGVTGLIPLTGITLPFMSQGGSSLIGCFIIVGLLLRAGDEGTGLNTEMTGTMQISPSAFLGDGAGVLGRVALGKRLTKTMTLLAVLFAIAIANLTYIQVVEADELQSRDTNNHTIAKQAQRERGSILTSDNVVLAQSVQNEDGTYSRTYPQGSMAAAVVGYYSSQYGTSGVEASMSSTLVGEENFASIVDVVRSEAGLSTTANDVVLTLDADIQQAAEDALSGQTGACVVLNTSTGAVLAEASAPTYDINNVVSLLDGSSSDGSLINRATGALYAPGSTFKVVTLAAALDLGIVTADSQYESPASIEIGNAEVTNHGGSSHGTISVEEALAVSSNTVFAQIADEMGAEKLVSYSESFGFDNDSTAQDFTMTTSLMPKASEMSEWETAWAGVGQPVGQHSSPAGPQTTVMQMAMVMAAISNDGVVLKPYIVDHVISSTGAVTATTSAAQLGTAMSPTTAQAEQAMLETVVTSGTGTAAQIEGATVIGKTGTAQVSDDSDNAWFIGTATANGQSVTIAMVIEDADGEGGTVAAPLARNVLYTALRELGAL